MLKARAALTLMELTVVLSLSGLALGIVVALGLRQGRLYADLGRRLSAQEQLRHAVSMLPVDLRSASPAAGDFIAGEARDTSLELRATLGSAVVCRAEGAILALAPADIDSGLTSYVSAPQAGDSIWLLGDSASAEWEALAIRGVSTSRDACPAGFVPRPAELGANHSSIMIDTGDSAVGRYPPGTPLRITRRVRYSIYRSSDGLWYLGYRDWNAVAGRFNGIQPVSGPFERPATLGGKAFRYFDSAGGELPAGTSNTRAIALVRITMRTTGTALFGSAALLSVSESSAVAVAPRNRR